MELDNEVAKLILERSGYQQEQYRLEDMAASLTSKIEILENIIPKNQNDFLYYQKIILLLMEIKRNSRV